MSIAQESSNGERHPQRGRRRGRGRGRGTGRGTAGAGQSSRAQGANAGMSTSHIPAQGTATSDGMAPTPVRERGSARRGGRGGKRGGSTAASSVATLESAPTNGSQVPASDGHAVLGRRCKFASKLTEANGEAVEASVPSNGAMDKLTGPVEYSDMRSRLVAELSSGAYDCVICYSCVTTRSPIWSCSQCYSVLHLPCVQRWAASSVAKVEEQNAMQEDPAIRERRGTWRCPGCQFARDEVPRTYLCWDGQTRDPVGGKGAPPHSCGRPCSRAKCTHGCAAGSCHPGPCPACPVSITRGCFCGSQQITLRCSQLRPSSAPSSSSVSCGASCSKMLDCGTHRCKKICHDGPCGGCEDVVEAKCYCGRHSKAIMCGQGAPKTSYVDGEAHIGQWVCNSPCAQPFDCDKHSCKRSCHALDRERAPCPFSPGLIKTCPCGAEDINEGRLSCEEDIKTCGRLCPRQLSCGHHCESRCHLGNCPPCTVAVSTPCRCAETKRQLACYQRQREEQEGGQEVFCQTVCRSLRLCGKHECRRPCCPLYFQAKSKSKRKPTFDELVEQDPSGLHTCDLICGKLLRCGTHHCEANCHRGQCPPCLQASFDELSCHCGR